VKNSGVTIPNISPTLVLSNSFFRLLFPLTSA
jgi:hypothetical protein